MRVRVKSVAGVVAMSAATAMFAAAPASASGVSWERSCGSTYHAVSYRAYAETTKVGSGCAGDAWVRVYAQGQWYNWAHHNTIVRINNGAVVKSQHKGCADCEVHTLVP